MRRAFLLPRAIFPPIFRVSLERSGASAVRVTQLQRCMSEVQLRPHAVQNEKTLLTVPPLEGDASEVKWLVAVGSPVSKDQPLCEANVGKAKVNVLSPCDGYLETLFESQRALRCTGENLCIITSVNPNRGYIEALHSEKIPVQALVLGASGLIPFWSATVGFYIDWDYAGTALFSQMVYASTILPFLGAVHWGLAISSTHSRNGALITTSQRWMQYGFGVVPPVLAAAALHLPQDLALTELILGYCGMLTVDIIFDRMGVVPKWYLRLRAPLTLGVIAALGATWAKLHGLV
jgi:hypothetical protein